MTLSSSPFRHNLTGVLEGALRSSNAQFEPPFVLDRIGIFMYTFIYIYIYTYLYVYIYVYI
jgi:hypothetical protein